MKKRCLITGATGLIGSSVLPKLIEEYEVFAITSNSMKERVPEVDYIQMDLDKGVDFNKLPGQVSVVIHLAQSALFRGFPDTAMDIFSVNTYTTMQLLDYAYKNKVQKFIYASSGGIYGNNENGFDEDAVVSANKDLGFYLSSKLCSEIFVENYSSFFDTILLRFFFVYGEKQNKTMLIPRLVDSIKNGIPIALNGTEGIKINPIYVEDAATAVREALMLSGSHKFNIGGSEVLSLREICNIIGDKVNKKPIFVTNEQLSKNLIGDIDKMKKILYSPKFEFKDAIEKLII